MGWTFLFIAILFEVAGTLCMKLADGFSKLVPSVLLFVFYGLTLIFLTLSLRRLELSIVYTIWSGVGTALIAVIGIFLFRESAHLSKLVCIFLVALGAIGLRFYH